MSQDLNNDDFISLSDIAIVFIKNSKLWFALILLGCMVTSYICYKHVDIYNQTFEIEAPNYIPNISSNININTRLNTNTNTVISVSKFSEFSKDALSLYKPFNSDYSIGRISKPNNFMLVSHNKVENSKYINDFISSLKKHPRYINQVSSWKNKTKSQIQSLDRNIEDMSSKLSLFDSTLTKISVSKGSSTDLLSQMGNTILAYQKDISQSKNKIDLLKSKLESFSPLAINYENLGAIKLKGPSKKIIFTLGLLLTFFLSSIVVFMIEFFRSFKLEVKQKLAS